MFSRLKLFGFALLLIIISSSFAQADSCNMWLVDEWTHSCPNFLICIEVIDSFIIAGLDSQVFVFDLGDDGTLTPIDSIQKSFNSMAVKDSFCYFMDFFDRRRVFVYKLETDGSLDSITTVDTISGVLSINDTLLFCWNASASTIGIYKIANPNLPVFLGSDEISGINSFFYADYPFVFNGGQISWYVGPPVYTWYQGKFYIHNITDFDSIYCTCERLSDFGDDELSSEFNCIIKKDSILYIGGENRYVNAYAMSNDGTSAEYLTSWEIDSEWPHQINPDNMEIIGNNLFTCGNEHFHIFDISDLDTIECIAYYDHGAAYPNYQYFVIRDSFYIGMGYDMDIDSVYITVAKFSDNGLGNCELRIKPDNFDLQISPNPFNSNCYIKYSMVDQSKPVTLDIYNINGKAIQSYKGLPSQHSFSWNAGNYPSGIYLVKARNGIESITHKIIYIR